jgi:hypothetical protein
VSATRVVAVAAYAAVFLAVAALEIVARRPDSRVPSLGDVCAFVARYRVGNVPVGRIAVLGVWWWVGWHFLAR